MKYRLLEKIGSGGMAEVFRAVGEGPEGYERPFVIKRIHPRLSDAPEFIRMFVDEAKISARLVHPNIVQVFEFVYEDGGYYIVMEPVDGVDMGRLFRRMVRKQELPPALFFAEVARQVCRGLEFAHALTGADAQPLGVVHRDVTPPNIMVDWNGTVKILDFGIARAIQELRTNQNEKGIIKGKMSYVAPEQLEGHVADARSDVFSLAVVLHELLSGRRLFLGENDLETLKLVRDMPIGPPSAHNPGVKPQLDEIVMKALERDPARRYGSAGEMGDRLEEFVLRRHFSTRLLAQKARELAPVGQEDALDAHPVVPMDGDVPAAPPGIGRADAIIALEGAAERRRKAPPPLPVEAITPRGSGPIASPPASPSPAATPSRPGFRLSAAASWVLLAVSFSAVLVALAVVVMVRRAAPAQSVALAALAATESRPATAQVSLDSVPQGATVTTAPGAAGARALGPTPFVLHAPRTDVPIELIFTKEGFAPLAFRVIANRDKDATAVLERIPPPPVVASTEDPPRRSRRRGSRRAAAAAAAAAAASQQASSATAGQRPAANSPRPVALAPAQATRR